MLDLLIGGFFGAFIASLIWARKYNSLLEACKELIIAHTLFRQEFDAYRSRYDPIQTRTDDNVTYIQRNNDVR